MMVIVNVIIVGIIALGWATKALSEDDALGYARQSSVLCGILLVLVWIVGFLGKSGIGTPPQDSPPP